MIPTGYESERVAGIDHDAKHGDPDEPPTTTNPGAAANANPAAEQIAAETASGEAQSLGNTSEEVTPGQLEEVIVTAQKRSERI